jgi:hypothetical protein
MNGLSQLNGNAVFVRSATFASGDTNAGHPYAYVGAGGKPTAFARAEMAHEMIHKFGYLHPLLENHLGSGYANAVKLFGSML